MRSFLILIFVIVVIAGCSTLPAPVAPAPSRGEVANTNIWIVSHGWHTGVVVPRALLADDLPELYARFTNIPWLEIGWGDRGFYQSPEITVGLALQAMFWSSGAVLHVVAVPETPERYFPSSDIQALCITDAQAVGLRAFLRQSFARDGDDRIIAQQTGIYGNSQFYAATGRYHLLHTCNTWTAKALLSAGQDLNPTFMLTAGSVMAAIRHGGACPAEARALLR